MRENMQIIEVSAASERAVKMSKGEIVICPYCKKDEGCPVEYYTVPGRTFASSRQVHECGFCNKHITVEYVGDDEYFIDIIHMSEIEGGDYCGKGIR